MNKPLLAMTAGTLSLFALTAAASESAPAWQEPGFVMEEVVVIARLPTTPSPSEDDEPRPSGERALAQRSAGAQ